MEAVVVRLRPPGSGPCRRQKVLLSPSVAAKIVIHSERGRPAHPHPIGNGVGIPDATFSGRRDQAIDISSEVMSIANMEYTRYSLSRGPGGSAPPSARKRARRGPTTNALGLTAHLQVASLASYPKT